MNTIQEFLDAKVGTAMREVVLALSPGTSIAAARRLFAERHITGAPVVSVSGEPVGVVSTSDLITAGRPKSQRVGTPMYYLMLHGDSTLVGSFPDIGEQQGVIEEVMTAEIVSVSENDPVRDAIGMMLSKEIHRVLVLREGKLVGIVSAMDVLRALVPGTNLKATSGF